MKPELCDERIQNLSASLGELEAEKRELEGRRRRLELPAIDRDMLSDPVANFEDVMAEGTNPQKKHLLRRLVKKVSMATENCTLLATENCTRRGESCRAERTFSR